MRHKRVPCTRVALLAGLVACSAPPAVDPGAGRQEILSSNRLTSNRLTSNRLTSNRLTSNRLTSNGLTSNALAANALITDALTSSALRSDGSTEGEAARDFLSYVYSCAMPEGASLELVIDGVDYGTLHGAVGLAPEWGEQGGSCDTTCQHWVTACLLARTNFWGVAVPLSIRGPHRALQPSEDEKAEYPLREGAYFGNIFDDASDRLDLYACAGPGSNVPQLTRRFCSGASSLCAFVVEYECTNPPGAPLPPPDDPAQRVVARRSCERMDPSDGSMNGCYTEGISAYGDDARGDRYREVITVYLKQPVAVCGDGVCTGDETAATCSDCSTGWAHRLGSDLDDGSLGLAVLPDGDVATGLRVGATADIGGTLLKALPDEGTLALARFGRAGELRWAKVIAYGDVGDLRQDPPIHDMGADSDGNIYIMNALGEEAWFEGERLGGPEQSFLAKYSPAGDKLWVRSIDGEVMFLSVGADGLPRVIYQSGLGSELLAVFSPAGDVLSSVPLPAATPYAILDDGSVLMSAPPDGSDVFFMRHHTDSGLTDSFAPPPAAIALARDAVMSPLDGSILVVGQHGASYSDVAAAIFRYAPDGTLLDTRDIVTAVPGDGTFTGAKPWQIDVNSRGEMLVHGTFVAPIAMDNDVYYPSGFIFFYDFIPEIFVGKYRADGEKMWSKAMGGAGEDSLMTAALLDDGRVLASGGFTQSGAFDGWILENPYSGGIVNTSDAFLIDIPDPVKQ